MKLWICSIGLSAFSLNIALSQYRDTTVYKFSEQVLANLESDTTEWRYQTAAYSFAFSGQYRKAISEWDIDAGIDKFFSKADSLKFIRNNHLVDARNFILKKAKKNRVVIFNEARYNPRNRVFVTSLLSALKKIGYTCFAAEALSSKVSLTDNMSPTFNTGYYTAETAFGNLIREAIRLNYTLVPYEATTMVQPKEREIIQARNLAVFLKANPSAKIIIYCGFGHILEDTLPNWGKAMAGRLNEFTGINPYTIDQVELSEHTKVSFESPFYRLNNSQKYSILVDKETNPFQKKGIDALLYSPRTRYIHGRPSWVFENGRKAYFINPNEIKLQFPIIIQAYLTTDSVQVVIPIDVIEIEKAINLPKTGISLPPTGSVIIIARDKFGRIQKIMVTNNRS